MSVTPQIVDIYFWTSPYESAHAYVQLFAHYGPLDFIDVMIIDGK
jgi:hypothetical protein